MAINIEDDLQTILIESGLDAATRSKIIKIAQEHENEKKEEKDPNAPKSKSKYTIVIRTDDPKVKDSIATGFIVKTPLDQDDNELINRMVIGGARNNENAKKKGKVATWVEFFQHVKSKFLKDEDVLVKIVTKEAVRIVWLDKPEIPFK
jgi:hypothetical protein